MQGMLYRRIFIHPQINRMRKKEKINVLFIACSTALWKVDSLYKRLLSHKRFQVEILIVPNPTIADLKMRATELQQLRSFFDYKGYHFVEWCDIEGNSQYENIPSEYDLLFYPQPYPGLVPPPLDFPRNLNKLLIDCEYAFHSGNQDWAYNKMYQNIAFLDCYENNVIRKLSENIKKNKGINSVTTGLAFVDDFMRNQYTSPWKKQPTPCKKIIWAPHWTITGKHGVYLNYSNFIELSKYMLEFAHEQIGKVQFAFKPHPWLKRELYKHPDWGKERTDAYYSAWEHGINTQLEQGEYIDLFMTSDAMIHDCSSFCCEYLLTGNPVLFMAKNEDQQVSQLNEMAKNAFYAQYIGYTTEDLHTFLNRQVFFGQDPKKSERTKVVETYLIPPNNISAAENIIKEILGK